MKLLIINGANLNLVGLRQTEIYGTQSLQQYLDKLALRYAGQGVVIEQFFSNIEGELVEAIQQAVGRFDGLIINAGGYTHTSVVVADAVAAVRDLGLPSVEVHISNILSREPFRHNSLLAAHSVGTITGFGLKGYELAVVNFAGR